MHELHVDSVRKTYGNTCILTDIFICCKPGDRIGLLGSNGSGKSTLLKIIFGSLHAEHKFIRVNGNVVHGLREIGRKVSYLPQHSFLPTHLPVQRILKLFCDRPQQRALYDNPHILPYLHQKSKTLSGGQRRMIEILLILNSGADYILLDEPFNGVEPLFKAYVKSLIKDHANEKGCIITDHDYKNVLDVSTQVILLTAGTTKKIEGEGDLIRAGYVPQN